MTHPLDPFEAINNTLRKLAYKRFNDLYLQLDIIPDSIGFGRVQLCIDFGSLAAYSNFSSMFV